MSCPPKLLPTYFNSTVYGWKGELEVEVMGSEIVTLTIGYITGWPPRTKQFTVEFDKNSKRSREGGRNAGKREEQREGEREGWSENREERGRDGVRGGKERGKKDRRERSSFLYIIM